MTQRILISLVIASVLLATATSVIAQREAPPVPTSSRDSFDKDLKKQRIREGKPITRQLCTFQVVGSRVAVRFVGKGNPADSEQYLCLENLQLERVLQAIQDHTTQMYWWIDGTFTEYRGGNYVLVQRIQQAPQSAANPVPPRTTEPVPPTGTKLPN
ncbi:MAG: hypothetical protein ACRC46_01550 [Thermoguttaceae bacterium]